VRRTDPASKSAMGFEGRRWRAEVPPAISGHQLPLTLAN
jgi:hypothetical protein